MDVLERILALLFSGGILGLALLLRRLSGTWATPAGLFCGFWFLFSFIPLLALYFVPVNPLAVGYILLACLAFSLPAIGVDWRTALRRNAELAPQRAGYLDSPLIRKIFIASFVISTLFILLDLLVQGISLEEMVFNFFESSNTYLEKRYDGDIEVNPFGQWGLIAAYLCIGFGGLLHAAHRPGCGRLLVLLLTMTPAVLVMLVQSAKGLFFLAIAIILGAHWVHRVLRDQRPHIDFSALLGQSKYLALAAPLILVSFLTRGLYAIDDNDLIVQRLQAYLASYAFLHIYTFSDWFTFSIGLKSLQAYTPEPLSFGYYTSIALFKLLGSAKEVPAGVYDEYLAVANLSPGNIYTVFRGLLTDFGIVGSLVVMYGIGAICNAAFRRALLTLHPTVSVALLFLFIQFLYTSYIISALIWNTTYLVTVLTAAILILNRYQLHANTAFRSTLAHDKQLSSR